MRKVLNDPRGTAILVGLGVVLLLTTLLASPWLWRTSRAEIIYVRPTATGAGNGTSWDNATTLRDALQHRAGRGDEVWIAAGAHYPMVSDNLAAVTDVERNSSFRVPSGVALYGGFAGTETTRDQRDPATNPTLLNGRGDSRIVVNLSGTDATTLLDGLIITGGQGKGGGLSIRGGSPTLTNVHIIGNGGAVVHVASGQILGATASRPTFIDVTISENAGDAVVQIAGASEVTFMGGTISNNAGRSVLISDDSTVAFTDMTISDSGFGLIISDDSTVTFTDMTISGSNSFGVSVVRESSATFTNVAISDNGGGVRIDDRGSATFTDVTISDNGDSGVRIDDRGSATFTDVTISDNGWGVSITGTASMTFTDVTLRNNGAGVSGGDESSVTCTNMTLRDNVTYEGSQPPTTCTGESPR